MSCHAKAPLDFTKGKAWGTIAKSKLVSLSPRWGDGSVTTAYQYGSHKSRLITQLLKKDTPCKAEISDSEWVRLVTWVDANAPNNHLMNSKRTADGKNWQWETYNWQDPWAQPAEIPAMGQYIQLPDNKWRRELTKQ